MVLVAILSDTHNKHNEVKIPECDILIHCGDATNRSTLLEAQWFTAWFNSINLPKEHKLFVPGNHDWGLASEAAQPIVKELFHNSTILINHHVNILGLDIQGIADEKDMGSMLSNMDIIITHYPANGILDEVPPHTKFNSEDYPENIGSNHVLQNVMRAKPMTHCAGHVHEQGGRKYQNHNTTFYNMALLDENYQLVRQPIVLDILPRKKN